jgi:hypothetical protein
MLHNELNELNKLDKINNIEISEDLLTDNDQFSDKFFGENEVENCIQ